MRFRSCSALSTLATSVILWLATSPAIAQSLESPLAPPDQSSPRATLKLFPESADRLGLFVEQEMLPSQSLAKFARLANLVETPVACLDLSEIAPPAQVKAGRAAAVALYETLNRIPLPPEDDWPRAGEYLFSPDTVARAEEYYQKVESFAYRRSVPHKNLRQLAVSGGGWLIPNSWINSLPPTGFRAKLTGTSPEQLSARWSGNSPVRSARSARL